MPDNSTEASGDGRLIEVDGRSVVRFVRRYPVSREKLWSALTDPDRMARWAFRGELEPRDGGTLRFDYGEGGSVDGTVLVWDEPSVLEYEWGADSEMPWHVRFELSSDDEGGTVLTFDHLLPDPSVPEFAAGWHWHLDRLTMHLGGVEPPVVDSDEHFDELLEGYRSAFGVEA